MQRRAVASGTKQSDSGTRKAEHVRRADYGKSANSEPERMKSRTLLQYAAFAAMSMTASQPTHAMDRYGPQRRSVSVIIGCLTWN